MRPTGTDFAESARHRESVLSLGSISHLQYYFARTGLLDGKGGQLARKRNPRATLDLAQLDPSAYLGQKTTGSDVDSSYASMASSPDMGPQNVGGGGLAESPIDYQDGFDYDEWEEPDEDVLPPTTSTYIHREKHVPKPPTIEELKSDLTQALDAAVKVLREADPANPTKKTPPLPVIPPVRQTLEATPPKGIRTNDEIQGMELLDVMTLAIRAAKVYYTSHEHPERLDQIMSEKEIRTELFSVMDVLKQMATRAFSGGPREAEYKIMDDWIESIRSILRKELEIEESERKERKSWTWQEGDWTGKEIERELAFLASLNKDEEPLPAWTPIEEAEELPTPFLESLQNGLRLVKFHNAAVRKSRRRFGAIPTYHTDTQKPYRCADNLRYWAKAAELRWEVMLKIDALGIVYNNSREVWEDFDKAIWKWCRKVREEVTAGWKEKEKEQE